MLSSVIRRSFYNVPAYIQSAFPKSIHMDDYMARVEMALGQHEFTGKNSIAMTNLCRDEVTFQLKNKIEEVFGSSFTTTGLGGVLTCGCTGVKAGLSHSPICKATQKERYVFFSFPHIGVDPEMKAYGVISRRGREEKSTACGALIKCLTELKTEPLASNLKQPGVHDPTDVEYSILKQRLARSLASGKTPMPTLDLVRLTQIAEETITRDLEQLVEKNVDKDKADYAIVTGIQIHNWNDPNQTSDSEYIYPSKLYVVKNKQTIPIDIHSIPRLADRQLKMLR